MYISNGVILQSVLLQRGPDLSPSAKADEPMWKYVFLSFANDI